MGGDMGESLRYPNILGEYKLVRQFFLYFEALDSCFRKSLVHRGCGTVAFHTSENIEDKEANNGLRINGT